MTAWTNARPAGSRSDRSDLTHEYVLHLVQPGRWVGGRRWEQRSKFLDGILPRGSVWSVATAPSSGRHPAPFPEALVEPALRATADPGDHVLDPFCGAGTVGAVAGKLGMNFTGIDLVDWSERS